MAKYCRSDARYIAVGSYLDHGDNKDIKAGEVFSINLLIEPFSFPPPIESIAEKSSIKPEIVERLGLHYADPFPTKYLLIYSLDDLCASDAVLAFVGKYIV